MQEARRTVSLRAALQALGDFLLRHPNWWDFGTAAALAALVALLSLASPFAMLDGLFFDRVTQYDSGRAPRVVIIEQGTRPDRSAAIIRAARAQGMRDIGFRNAGPATIGASGDPVLGVDARAIGGSLGWTLESGEQALPEDARLAANLVAAPEGGIYRRQLRGLPAVGGGTLPLFETAMSGRDADGGPYLVPMPRAQNIPRITAEQLTGEAFADGALDGLVGIVAPPPGSGERSFATPLALGVERVDATSFSAYATQALIDGREVVRVHWLAALIAILLASCLAVLLLRRRGAKNNFLTKLVFFALGIGALCVLVLLLGRVLLPLSALLLAFFLSAVSQVLRNEKYREGRLQRTVEQAIDLSFDRALLGEGEQVGAILAGAAPLLQLDGALLLGREPRGEWTELSRYGDAPTTLALDTPEARRHLADAHDDGAPVAADIIATDAREGTLATHFVHAESEYLWLYRPADGPQRERIAGLLADAVRDFAARKRWQKRLLAQQQERREPVSLDRRIAGAAKLVVSQSEQVRHGLDTLETAIFVFHPLGLPVQANSAMLALLDEAELSSERTNLIELITTLTELGENRARSLVRELILKGGEMRVPMHDFGTRQRVLRIGMRPDEEDHRFDVLVLEAIDITELNELADLRLAVGNFIDRQLRNDLEALTLGASLARDKAAGDTTLERLLGRILDVVRRATGRLEHVAALLGDEPDSAIGVSYPLQANKVVQQAIERAQPFADDLGVAIEAEMPAISGFTLAEPGALSDMLEAMLRLVAADTPQDGSVSLVLEETEGTTSIHIAGGFGLPFDRLCAALDAKPGEVQKEYRIASTGMAKVVGWGGTMSYWSAVGDGFRFDIKLRRIG